MDWENERYVRVYVRDTPDLLAIGWEGRAVLWEMMRKCDRAGVIDFDGEIAVLADLLRMPEEVVERALGKLERRGIVERSDQSLVLPNFLDAQEAKQSDKQRARESRARRRDQARHGMEHETKTGWIYFAQAGDGSVKIGFASDVAARLSNLKTARPDGVSLLGSVSGALSDEQAWHATWAHLRIGGEWYTPDVELLAAIRGVTGRDAGVTPSHSRSQPVTAGHTSSQPVTPCRAVPSHAVPSQDQSIVSAYADTHPLKPSLEGGAPGEPGLGVAEHGTESSKPAQGKPEPADAMPGGFALTPPLDRPMALRARAQAVCRNVVGYLNAKTGRSGAGLLDVTAEGSVELCSKLITAGYTADQIRDVIDAKVAEWQGDDKMAAYLKPGTLLRLANFKRYIADLAEPAQRPVANRGRFAAMATDDAFRGGKVEI